MPKQYFEFVDGKSSKFWHIEVNKGQVQITYGRIGTSGRESVKKYAALAKAKAESEKLIRQKTKKGYQKVSAAAGKQHLTTSSDLSKKKPAKKKVSAAKKKVTKPKSKASKKPKASKPSKKTSGKRGVADSKPGAEEFQRAIKAGRIEQVKSMLKAGAGVNLICNKGDWMESSPLSAALHEGRWAIAKLLIKSGANLKYKAYLGTDLLMIVAENPGPDQLKAAKFLIKEGLKVDAVSKQGLTPLLGSIIGSSVEFTKFLIKQGANPNRQTKLGTPLMWAVDQEKPEQIQCLLDAGANPQLVIKAANDPDYVGKTPYEAAVNLVAKGLINKKVLAVLTGGESGARGKVKKKKSKVSSVQSSWKRIELALANDFPAIRKSLGKGATEKTLAKLEKQLGVKLSADILASLAIHNGQNVEGTLFSDRDNGDFYLLPVTEIVSDWKMLKMLVGIGEFEDQTSRPDKGIRDDWYNLGWIPLLSNGGGDLICVDLAPAKGGKKGQVLMMNHDSASRQLLAKSFKEFLSHMADEIEDGSLENA